MARGQSIKVRSPLVHFQCPADQSASAFLITFMALLTCVSLGFLRTKQVSVEVGEAYSLCAAESALDDAVSCDSEQQLADEAKTSDFLTKNTALFARLAADGRFGLSSRVSSMVGGGSVETGGSSAAAASPPPFMSPSPDSRALSFSLAQVMRR